MADEERDDIKEWLQEIQKAFQESDPFVLLKQFRQERPDDPIPPDLEFAAKVVDTFGLDDTFPTGEQQIAAAIDEILENEPREGAPFADWHPEAFLRIEYLMVRKGMNERAATKKVGQERRDAGHYIEDDSVRRMYQRHRVQRLLDRLGNAVRDNDEAKGIAALEELERRAARNGRRR